MEDQINIDSPAESTEKYLRALNSKCKRFLPAMTISQLCERIKVNKVSLRVYLARGEISNHTKTFFKNRLKYISGLTKYDIQYIKYLLARRQKNDQETKWQ